MPPERKKTQSYSPKPFLSLYAPTPTAPTWLRVVFPLLVAVAAFVAFLPALDAGFVNWDDDKNIINNPNYRGLDAERLHWMFTKTKMGHWQPLSWITLAMDYKLHGEDHPGGYHLTNMLLHAAGATAFYFLALRLLALAFSANGWHGQSRSQFGAGRGGSEYHLTTPHVFGVHLRLAAAIAALFFAVHPLRVEAVAWVTERRDVLSGLFFIATINAYLISRTAPRFRKTWYLASIGLLILSVLSKAWGMTMPAILLVLDFYPLRRFSGSGSLDGPTSSIAGDHRKSKQGGQPPSAPSRKRTPSVKGLTPSLTPFLVVLEKLPFIVIAALVAYQAKKAQAGQLETLKTLAEHGVVARIAQAFYGLSFYVYKTIAPFSLIPLYQIPENMNPFEPRFIISALAIIAAAVLLIRYRRHWPAGLALATCYVAIFSPVSGIAQSGPQLVKDSYTYLCCLSWATLVGGLLIWAGRRLGSRAFNVCAIGGAVLVMALGVLTWRQTKHWRDSKSLWAHTLAVDQGCWNAHNNMAILVKGEGDRLKKEGRSNEAGEKYRLAAEHYRRSLEIHPKNADALFNQGNCQKAMGDFDAAIASYLAAIDIGPDHAPGVKAARMNLANTYQSQGKLDQSIPVHEAIARKDGTLDFYISLGEDLQKVGRTTDAEQYYRRALNQRPNSAEARTGLGLLLLARGDCVQAKTELQQAVAAEPNYRPAAAALARAKAQCP